MAHGIAGAASLIAAGCFLLAGSDRAWSQAPEPTRDKPAITIELNKLEPAGAACRAYFVAENRTPETVRELRLDTYIFEPSGVIARRIGLTFTELRPGRPKVASFELSGSACGEMGRFLVNDVLACTGSGGASVPGCGDLLAVSSRTSTPFAY